MDFLTRKIVNLLSARTGRGLTDAETRFLLSAARDQNRQTARCDVAHMEALLRHDPGLLRTVGPAALHAAVQFRGTETAVRLLIERGVRACDLGPGQDSPLHAAVRNDNLEGLRLVLEAGAGDAAAVAQQPNGDGPAQTTALFWVAHLGRSPDYVDLLLAHGADPEAPVSGNGERGTTILQEAVAPPSGPGGVPAVDPVWAWHKHEVARALIARGARYDMAAAAGLDDLARVRQLCADDRDAARRPGEAAMTPLHWAARNDAVHCAAWLLRRGADAEARTRAQRAPMHLAADWNHTDMLWLLAGAGADVDARDAQGRTPLHRAAFLGRVEAAEVLVLLQADRDAVDDSGRTPAQVARQGCAFLFGGAG